MTLITDTCRIPYACDGVSLAYAIPFTFFGPAEIAAVLINADGSATIPQVYAANYTIVGGSGGPGTLTATVAFPAGYTLLIYRQTNRTQLVDLVANDDMPSDVLETSLDRLTAQTGELAERLGRAVSAPMQEDPLLPMPPRARRASALLGFDAAGQPIAVPYSGFYNYGPASLPDTISISAFGAKCDGVTDDTAAWQLAFASRRRISMPAGSSLCGDIQLNDLRDVLLTGVPRYGSVVIFTGANVGWDFHNAQNVNLHDMAFQPSASNLTGSGVQFTAGSGNCQVERCQFYSFKADGLRLYGAVGQQMSGHIVRNGLFLSNAHSSLFSTYSNDFRIEGNQFGILAGQVHPQYGCLLDHSGAGTYTDNYHWNNTVGLGAFTSHYNRFENNRIEESDQQDVSMQSCDYTIFQGNTVHTSSEASTGTADAIVFLAMTHLSVVGNQVFQWSGLSHYSITIGPGCAYVTLRANICTGFATSPYFIDPTDANAIINSDATVSFNSGGNLPAATTTYIGSSGTSFTEGFVQQLPGRQAEVIRFYAACSVAPGAGQSFTYQLRQNGIAVGPSIVITAGNFFSVSTNVGLLSVPDNTISIQLITSAGAAAAAHRCSISLVDY